MSIKKMQIAETAKKKSQKMKIKIESNIDRAQKIIVH